MINKFLNIFFPESCPICKNLSTDHTTAPICPDCWQSVTRYAGPECPKCGRPLVSDVSLTCGECLKNEPSFTWARSFGLYEGTLREAIHHLKYYGIKRLARPLSDLMITMEFPRADAMIPVPLYKKRLRKREFNHAALLGRYLAGYSGIPLVMNTLVKVRDTAPQVGLNAKDRKKNIKNAFDITNRGPVLEKDIVLVDDVYTTGATIRECSELLKKEGANNIYVMLLAHSRQD
jgi:ComF family protein